MNEWKLNAVFFDQRMLSIRYWIHDAHGNPFRQLRPADKHDDAVLYTTLNLHIAIVALRNSQIKLGGEPRPASVKV